MILNIWYFPPDWSTEVKVSYEYKTEVISSRSNKEQRIANRDMPRIIIEFESMVREASYRALATALMGDLDELVKMPEWSRGLILEGSYGVGGTSVTVEETDAWLAVGKQVIMLWGDPESPVYEVKSISAISGRNLTFSAALTQDIPDAVAIFPLWSGRLDSNIKVSFRADSTALVSVKFDVDPAQVLETIPAAPLTYNGREFFDLQPDWSRDISHTWSTLREIVDYGHGRIAVNSPVGFNDRVMSASFTTEDRTIADRIRNLFIRAKGQQGEFFMPTFTADLGLLTGAPSGANSIRVRGTDVSDKLWVSPVYKHLCIIYMDGTIRAHSLDSVEVVSDSFGQNDRLYLSPALTRETTLNNVSMICWLPLWRFVTDQLTVQWITDSIATIGVSCKTLEALPAET